MATAALARLLMWPGVPVTAWATMRPRRSNMALARSPASRTMGLKFGSASTISLNGGDVPPPGLRERIKLQLTTVSFEEDGTKVTVQKVSVEKPADGF